MLSLILKTIWRNGRRSILSILGIAVSVFLICCLVALTNGFQTLVKASSENNLLATYEKKRACPWTSKLDEHYADKIRTHPSVADVTTELIIAAHYGESGHYANLIGIDPVAYTRFRDIQVTQGSYQDFKETTDGAIVGSKLCALYGWKVGDLVTLKQNSFAVKVCGIFRSPNGLLESFILVHNKYAQESFRLEGKVSVVLVKPRGSAESEGLSTAIDREFLNYATQTKTQPERAFWSDLIWQLSALNEFFELMIAITVVTSVLAAANSVSMGVRERIREIGILRCLGYGRARIFGLIVGEAMILATVGGILGAAAASAAFLKWDGLALSGVTLPATLTPMTLVAAVVLAALVGLMGSLWQSLAIARRKIVACLGSTT
jgi:putative ABC transport system permease protein